MRQKGTHTGLRARHRAKCATQDGGECNCKPSWEAFAYSARHKKKIRKMQLVRPAGYAG